MFRKLFALLLLFSFSTLSYSQITLSKDKINITTGIKSWATTIKLKAQHDLLAYTNGADGYTECKRTTVAPNVILCGTFLQRDMNSLLLRPTIFSEGGIGNHQAGDVIPNNSRELLANADIVGGHDIKSKQLLEFYAKTKMKCAKDKKFCLTKNEKLFYDKVVKPISATDKSFVIITYSVQSCMPSQQIVSHEFLHAMYFLDDKYKKQINKFWDTKLSNKDRALVRKQLKTLGYNDKDEPVMRNEFQAYMLMDGAEDARLSSLVPKYENKMFKFLKASMA